MSENTKPVTYFQRITDVRDKLNEVGKGFCLMKWQTETLYLHMGDNHSCYHPQPHKIQLSDIQNNPSGLHNTAWKKLQRKEMLEGGRPGECYYCWNIEDLPGEHISDRMVHSTSDYAIGDLEEIKKLPWDANWNPRHIEVSFGNGCNLRCGYCCPQASSLWMDEVEKHGDYDITSKQYNIDFLKTQEFYKPNDENPYVDAFWAWWPELRKDLKVFRITGGEPLMNSNTFKLLDMLDKEPAPDLQLHINSNLGVTPRLVEKMSRQVAKLLAEGKIKDFRLFTSIDGWGKQAEYMRTGLNCEVWEQNMRTFLDIVPNSRINFMITFNVLCVATFRKLLDKIVALRKEFGSLDGNGHQQRISFDTPYLKEPPHWMINILPKEFIVYMYDHLRFMQVNGRNADRTWGFDQVEYEKLKRVVDYMEQNPVADARIRDGRRDFYSFFTENDKRLKTDFLTTFPEYTGFYKLCEQVYENNKDSGRK